MVKRSRVDCSSSSSSSSSSSTGGVVVTVGRVQLTLWCVALLCGAGGAGGAVASGSSLGDRSLHAHAAASERTVAATVAAGGSAVRYADDATAAARNKRLTANLPDMVGTGRKITMIVRNRFLQVFPDGVVNSTEEDSSDYVILQRTAVNMTHIKIQGVATCLYLCMDACGLPYGSKDFDEDCLFNEMIQQNNYNTYSLFKYTDNKTFYLGFNKHGLPRKVQVKGNGPLGKLSKNAQVLTLPVPADRIDRLLATRRLTTQRPASGEGPTSTSHGHRHHHACPPHFGPPNPSKPRKSGRKCQTKGGGSGSGSRKKSRENQELAREGGGGGRSREEEDCVGGGNKKSGRCGGDETGHRKTDAAGRKKKSKKPTAVGGKGDKPNRQPGKSKKPESVDAAVSVQTAVTTVAAPSQLVDENDGGGDDDDDPTAAATDPTTDD